METQVILPLLISGFLLIFAELLLPGGVIGILGALSLIAGIVGIIMNYGFLAGIWSIAGVLVLLMLLLYFWFRVLSKSTVAKRLFAEGDAQEWHSYNENYSNLLGQTGISHTMLRPSGKIRIEGVLYDVVTQGDVVEAGTNVKVIEVEGNRIVVEKIEI